MNFINDFVEVTQWEEKWMSCVVAPKRLFYSQEMLYYFI